MNFSIQKISSDPVKSNPTELVEKKGIGHPDSICDGIAENISKRLTEEYKDRFGKILHHNTDEVQLIAGESKTQFGGGELVSPIYILLGGRATKEYKGETVPVDEIALKASRNYIEENFSHLSTEHVEFESRIGESSRELKSLFNSNKTPLANDTSIGVGHAPLSPLEKITKDLEHSIRNNFEEIGEDIKIMSLRKNKEVEITVAAAFIGPEVKNSQDYISIVKKVKEFTEKLVTRETDYDVSVKVNTADKKEKNSFYITHTGTSAEMGDDGSVGRGNRVNGLITPHRPMSLEAASGKNPLTHVGKIYNISAKRLANRINAEDQNGFTSVKMLSEIGNPIDEPSIVEVNTTKKEDKARQKIRDELDDLGSITQEIINGDLTTF